MKEVLKEGQAQVSPFPSKLVDKNSFDSPRGMRCKLTMVLNPDGGINLRCE